MIEGTSLVVQWLELCAPNAEGLGLIPGQGTRSHMLQLRVPGGTNGKEPTCQCRKPERHGGLIPGLGISPGEGMATHSGTFAGESHEQRSLVGYSP